MSLPDLGPFTQKIFLTETTIDRMALAALSETQLLPKIPGPVDIGQFCIRNWGWEVQYFDLGPDLMGQCAFSEAGVESIEINSRIWEDKSRVGRVRLRSTTAHEIGHGLAHKELFALKIRQERLQARLIRDKSNNAEEKLIHACPGDQIVRPRKKEWWEIQANMLMRALLLPTPLLRQVVEAGRGRYSPESYSIPPLTFEVAQIFDVSFQMARIAVEEMLTPIKKESKQMASGMAKL